MPFVYIIGGGGSDMVKADLTSQIDGEKTIFIVPEVYTSGSLRVYYNGIRQVLNVTFTETTTTTFTLNFIPESGNYLTIDYSRG